MYRDDNESIPTKSKYRAAFDRGGSAANLGKPPAENPYDGIAPQRAKCWRDGWQHWHDKRLVTDDLDFEDE